MADQHEHSAQLNHETRLRNHRINWNQVISDDTTRQYLERFENQDYAARSPEGDKSWCKLLSSQEAAELIAGGYMKVLNAESTNSTDAAHIVLLLDDLVQDERKYVQLFRGANLEENLEILLRLLSRHGSSGGSEADLLNQRLLHLIAVLFYPGLGFGEAVDPNSTQMSNFARHCVNQLAFEEDTSLRGVLHALSALQVLLREQNIRSGLNAQLSIHRHCAKLLQPDSKLLRENQNNNQLLYQLAFCLWLLSYDQEIAEELQTTEVVQSMLRVMRDVTKEKVLRVCVACFRNLVNIGDHNERMIQEGALKQLVILRNKTWSDEEVVDDLQVVADALAKSVKVLSSVDKYRQEVNTGQLNWTPVHKSESFFRENAEKFAPLGKLPSEFEDLILLCNLLREKFRLAHKNQDDRTTIAVICHDLGEFARWHPRGKKILNEDSELYNDDGLGSTKSIIMKLMTDEADPEISKHALTCIHKMMVNNWQFLEPSSSH